MNVEYLIVGQGICGSFLSYYLRKANQSFLVIDQQELNSSSAIAAGIINPVTGRRLVKTWMIEELLPFAWQAYAELGQLLGITAISQKNLIDFFPSPQMLEAFKKRMEEQAPYLHSFPEQNHFNPYFNYDFGCGEIRPVYTAHADLILPAWKQLLSREGCLLKEAFDIDLLRLKSDGVEYKDIQARKIIFCDGAKGFDNPWFSRLPFAPNKGEALQLQIPDLPAHFIYKKGMMLVPLNEPDLFWIGSSYEWDFNDTKPSKRFLESTRRLLYEWLKIPFTITAHLAGVRPATIERRPFVGIHPVHRQVGILNGMGTKGFSLAPYFAQKLRDFLVFDVPLPAEADIQRFHKILVRN